MERNEAKIYGLCLKMLGNQEDAEDCLQEVFIKAFKALPGFREEARFSTWLYRIAYNESLMRLRKKKLDTVPLDRPVELEEGDVSRDLADWTNDPRADMMNSELSDVLVKLAPLLAPNGLLLMPVAERDGALMAEIAAKLKQRGVCRDTP